jgi:hypothetical protein
MRRAAGYTLWVHTRNEDFLKGLHTPQITGLIEKYRSNWKEQVGRMSADRIPNTILKG